jgi:hypothetical protein
VEVTCTVPYAVRYLDVRDGPSVPEFLGSQAPSAEVAAARAAGLCRFFTVHDTTGQEHPRQRAESEFAAHERRRQELVGAATDLVREQWQAELQRGQSLQRLTQQLQQARAAAGNARDEAVRLLARGASNEEAAQAEESADAMDRRVRTLEAALAGVPTVEQIARRDPGAPQRRRQQSSDQAFSQENDTRLAEVYRMLGALVYVGEDGARVPAAQLLFEASWRGDLAGLLHDRLGVQRP